MAIAKAIVSSIGFLKKRAHCQNQLLNQVKSNGLEFYSLRNYI